MSAAESGPVSWSQTLWQRSSLTVPGLSAPSVARNAAVCGPQKAVHHGTIARAASRPATRRAARTNESGL